MKTKTITKQLAAITATLALLLTLLPAQPAQAAFPGLNGRVVFQSDRDGDVEIYTMKLDGSDVLQLTDNSYFDGAAEWSPDGTKIVFASDRDGNIEIYTMKLDGTNQTRITNNPAFDGRPAWSPDGSKIVFHSDRDGNQEIFTMNSDGNDVFQVTNTAAGINGNPSWSPDGSKLAFNSASTEFTAVSHDIVTADIDGSNPFNVTNAARGQTEPRWAPSGDSLLYNNSLASDTEVFSIKLDGSDPTNITNNLATDSQADYSADGTRISFRSNRDSNEEIYIMNADGSDQSRLTSDSGSDAAPHIQPLTIKPTTTNPNLTLDASNGEAATYNTVSNHTDTYEAIDPTSVTITTQPQKGSLAVNESTGDITYTKNQQAKTGFNLLASLDNLFFRSVSAQAANQDSFSYQICSTANSQLCTDNTVTVNLASAASLASTGDNSYNPVLISALLSLAGSTIWLIRRKYFNFV